MTDDNLPYEVAPFAPGEIPAFASRLFERLLAEEPTEDFTFDGADVTPMYGCWAVELGGYAGEEDPAAVPEEAGAVPSAPYARTTWDWLQGVRAAFAETWGTPTEHTLRLVGDDDQPEGILDVALLSLGMTSAELWDRGDVFAALLTGWFGEPGTGTLAQILFVMPRAIGVTDFATVAAGGPSEQPHMARGEHPVEIHRRAWTLATLLGQREEHVTAGQLTAERIRVDGRDGEMTLTYFADDGRILLLVTDPDSAFATDAVASFLDDLASIDDDEQQTDDALDPSAGLTDEDVIAILRERLLSDVPQDLRELLTASSDPTSSAAEIPPFTGVAWFDGRTWWISGAALALARRNGWALEDYGFGDEFVRTYRLGGDWEAEGFLRDGDASQNAAVMAAFDSCPYPSQSRPADALRLGRAMPTHDEIDRLLDETERFAALWWDRSPDDAAWNDASFQILDHDSRGDDRARTVIVGSSWPWTADAFGDWTSALFDAAVARWGEPQAATARIGETGAMQRTPLGRILRAIGFPRTPLWWVNGHAVTLLAGFPDMALKAAEGHTDDALTDEEALVVVAIVKPDGVVDLVQGMGRPETRRRLSLISTLGGYSPEDIRVDGPALPGTSQVPPVSHGRIRADDRWWEWYLTHDDRGLLFSVPVSSDDPARSEADPRARFEGAPDDLVALVPQAERPEGAGWPDARAVLWLDGPDWRSSAGMLAEIRRDVDAGAPEGGVSLVDALGLWHDHDYGVRKLRWVLQAGENLTEQKLLDAAYATVVFSEPIDAELVTAVLRAMGDALSQALAGTLSDFLAQWAREPDARYLLDAALSNADPAARRDIALWLLQQDADASGQLSLATPLQVLLLNPTFGAADAELVARLIDAGARADAGTVASALPHPVRMLVELDLPDDDILPVIEILLGALTRSDEAPLREIEIALEQGDTPAQRAGRDRHVVHARLRDWLERLAENAAGDNAS